MRRRFLNIASIVCLILCVALMGMWVRSYWRCDYVSWHSNAKQENSFTSKFGRLQYWRQNAPQIITTWTWGFGSRPISAVSKLQAPQGRLASLGFVHATEPLLGLVYIIFPYWVLAIASGSLAMICRFRWPWRCTLRHHFIATTFLAVVLGMIALLDRAWIGNDVSHNPTAAWHFDSNGNMVNDRGRPVDRLGNEIKVQNYIMMDSAGNLNSLKVIKH
jgi:hypothetical protein